MANKITERMRLFDTIAYQIAREQVDINEISKYKFEERAYILQLAGLYKQMSFQPENEELKKKCKKLKEDFRREYRRTHTDLYFERKHYENWVQMPQALMIEETKLAKQINELSPDILNTALKIIDIYSGKNIYCKLYKIIKKGTLTQDEVKEYINNCDTFPEQIDKDTAYKILQKYLDLIAAERTVDLFRSE